MFGGAIVRIRAVALALFVLALCVAPAAHAAYPGRNGAIAALVEGCPRYVNDNRDIWLISPKGHGFRDLTGCDRNALGASWAPSGRRLAVSLAPSNSWDGRWFTMRADGSVGPEIPVPRRHTARVHFAPDGRHVSFVRTANEEFDAFPDHPNSIWSMRLDGSDKRLLFRPASDCAEVGGGNWSPDGRKMLVTVVAPDGCKGRNGTWVLDVRTGKRGRRLTKSIPYGIDWAPGGRRVVYSTRYRVHMDGDEGSGPRGKARGGNVWVVGVNGKHRRLVVRTRSTAAVNPQWSPDGRWIAYVVLRFARNAYEQDIAARIERVRARGGRRRLVHRLPLLSIDEDGLYLVPSLDWQPRPR